LPLYSAVASETEMEEPTTGGLRPRSATQVPDTVRSFGALEGSPLCSMDFAFARSLTTIAHVDIRRLALETHRSYRGGGRDYTGSGRSRATGPGRTSAHRCLQVMGDAAPFSDQPC
jgi:hypothetical protein